jgi:hypothetical protein
MNGIFKLILIAAPVTGLILWLVMTQQEQHREIMKQDKQEFKQQLQKFDDEFADAWNSKPIVKSAPVTSPAPAGETQEAELRAARQQLGTELKNQQEQSVGKTFKDVIGGN